MSSASTSDTTWRPTLGAIPDAHGVTFRMWSSRARSAELILETRGGTGHPREHAGAKPERAIPMTPRASGRFETHVPGAGPGDRYRFRFDGETPFPDPASRFQPEGVHGASEVVDPAAFPWSDAGWRGVAIEDLILYELHVGTFTRGGTFAAARARLPDLVALGITAIELMPLADFPGNRNWGYDGAALFAPARCYGTPDDLRRLIDEAHRLGLAVHLDVVYNHLGPDGAYLAAFSPAIFSSTHSSPWGSGINLDGAGSQQVRDFFIENTLHWIHEYHVDGLRLDATHAMVDESGRHFLAELSARVRECTPMRHVLVIAEDARNLAHMVESEARRGWGMDGVWADDFHHQMRVFLAGDHDGYFRDFSGTIQDLTATIRQGWFFTGQTSAYWDMPRGTDPSGIDPPRFVVCIQNHDQIGNRALGERLHHQIDLAAYHAASAVLLCAPQTPLLFMGQEWAASSPFLFFTDHSGPLASQVTEGRRHEFRHFSTFADPEARARIPDPQARETFLASRLDWSERSRDPHRGTLALYRALIALRRSEPSLHHVPGASIEARPWDEETLLIRRQAPDAAPVLLVARLRGAGEVEVPDTLVGPGTNLLDTEDPAFVADPRPMAFDSTRGATRIRFERPGAVLLRAK